MLGLGLNQIWQVEKAYKAAKPQCAAPLSFVETAQVPDTDPALRHLGEVGKRVTC